MKPEITPETISLRAGDAAAEISTYGAEPVSWRARGLDLLWSGDAAHWNRRAPVLFPTIGASAGGAVRVDGQAYPMPRHGFARDRLFRVVAREEARVALALEHGPRTLPHYPFAFGLEVEAALTHDALALAFTVRNPGDRALPYALGFHPAFPWPFAGGAPEAYRVAFEAPEDPSVPDLTPDGLLREGERRLPLQGAVLPLDPQLFARDALVMRHVRSRSLRFEAPTGEAVVLATEGFPHAALWTKPGSPFLSLEAWTGHADPEGFSGEMADKPSIRLLAPGATATHRATMRLEAA